MIALIAIAVVALAILAVHLGMLARQERQSQMPTRVPWNERRHARYTFKHGRTYGKAGYQTAVRMKERAARRKTAALKEGDQRVVQMAEARRKAD